MDIVNESYRKSYLPSNIRLLRKQKKWSQGELAKKIGLNRGNIASYENGTAEPKICNLLKMAHLFGVNLLTLIQKDLNEANHQHLFQNSATTPEMRQYLDRAEELQSVIDGLNICCRYKVKNMNGDLPPEMQLIALHFDELYQATQTLLNQHLALLTKLDNHPGNDDQPHSS
ncbi:MAG TPA: helix-turn-helix transcriptional regulator [Saprospiraceae bacterium]|nr:helix-turn-helix transcriptional regulator [Saprospiraceae bacterium]